MKKSILIICLLSLISTQAIRSMHAIGLPTSFKLETALDKITVDNVCQGVCRGLTFASSIVLFYHAADNLALSFKRGSNRLPAAASNEEILHRQHSRQKTALVYFLSGCIFTAAGLIQQYGQHLLPWTRALLRRQ